MDGSRNWGTDAVSSAGYLDEQGNYHGNDEVKPKHVSEKAVLEDAPITDDRAWVKLSGWGWVPGLWL